MRLAALALLAMVAVAPSACDSEPEPQAAPAGEPRAATAPADAVGNSATTFRPCSVPSGGFRVRAVGLPCSTAGEIVQHFRAVRQLDEFRFRDPSTRPPLQVSREVVWRARGGWTCLTQALPRVRVTQFLCVRGEQVLLWRVA
jgi:hypothetical protein